MTTQSPETDPMAQHPTSLKIPSELKDRIDRLAKEGEESPHALMVRALEAAVDSMERRRAFYRDADEADREMLETGMGYAFDDVATYLRAKVAGKKAKRPKLVSWRK
jgi:predicted transcriptional regulator